MQKWILNSICLASIALSSVVMAKGSAESASVHIFSFRNGARIRYEFNGAQPSQDSISFKSNDTLVNWAHLGTIGAAMFEDPRPQQTEKAGAFTRRQFEKINVAGEHDGVFVTRVKSGNRAVGIEFNGSTILIDDQGRTLALPIRQDYTDLLTADWLIGNEVVFDGRAYLLVFKSTFADDDFDEEWLIDKVNRSYGIAYAKIKRTDVESAAVRTVLADGRVKFVDKSNTLYEDESLRLDLPGPAEVNLAKMTNAKGADVSLAGSVFASSTAAVAVRGGEVATPLQVAEPVVISKSEVSKLKKFIASVIGIGKDKFVFDLLLATEVTELRQHVNSLEAAIKEIHLSYGATLSEANFNLLITNHPDLAPLMTSVVLRGLDILPAHPTAFATPLQFQLARRLVRLSVAVRALPLTFENAEIEKSILDRLRIFNLSANHDRLRRRLPEVSAELDTLSVAVRLALSVLTHDTYAVLKVLDTNSLSLDDLNVVSSEFVENQDVEIKVALKAATILNRPVCISALTGT